jgi:uncharacterized membrane protein
VTPAPRRLGILLAVSVALNVFLLGFLCAQWLRPHPAAPLPERDTSAPRSPASGETARGTPSTLLDWSAAESLAERNPALRQLLERDRAALRDDRRAVRESRARVRRALAAEPVNPEELARALEALRTSSDRAQARVHVLLQELAPKLPAEERRRLAEPKRRGPRREHGQRGGPHAPGPR